MTEHDLEERLIDIETAIANQDRIIEDLNQVVIAQGKIIDKIEENSLEAIAINKVIEECKTNKALNNLIFGEEKMESEKSYFAY